MTIPPWAPPLARLILAILALGIGLSGWSDGWGMALVPIASGIIVAELVGHYGLTQDEANQALALLEDPEVRAAFKAAADAFKARLQPPTTPPTP